MEEIGDIGLRVRGLTASYGSRSRLQRVLNGVTFDAYKGAITVVIGSSGAGKSTLINCVAGLQPIEEGEVHFILDEGQNLITCNRKRRLVPNERRSVGTCFQQSHLWSHMSVIENLVHPQVWLKSVPRAAAVERAEGLLRSLRLQSQANSPVSQLSGGQRQRVAILRALAVEPEILLLDEITASQDPANVQSIFDLVKAYVKRSGCTVLTISHDMQFVRKIADKVHLIESGVIVESCTSAELVSGRTGTKMARFAQAFEAGDEPAPSNGDFPKLKVANSTPCD